MSNPFMGEIRIFGGGFAPKNWALCNGAILSISQNRQLFAILGTLYGGNGTTTFALPNLVDRVPLGAGQGVGLSNYAVGQQVGQPTVVLQDTNMPPHSHNFLGNPNAGDQKAPSATTAIARAGTGSVYVPDTGTQFDAMDPSCFTAFTGGGMPHNNLQPYLGVTYIIALAGVIPQKP